MAAASALPGPRPRAALPINLFLFGLVVYLGSAHFETNDDVSMMLIASGVTTGEPSEYLIFSNILIGRLLKWLYGISGAANWYSIYLYAVHFAASTAMLYVFLRFRARPVNFLCYLLLFVGFELRALLELQFTSAAMVAALAGLLLLLAEPRTHGGGPRIAAGVALLVLAAMVRHHVLYLALMLSVPLVLCEVFRSGSARIPILLALAASFCFIAIFIDHLAYSSADWRAYREYNQTRSVLHDFSALRYDESSKPVYDAIGWSRNDLAMFNSWFFSDESVYSHEKLRKLAEELGGGPRPLSRALRQVRFGFRVLWVALAIALLNVLVVLAWKSERSARLLILMGSMLLLSTGIFLYLALFKKLAIRVMMPTLFFVNATFLFAALAEAGRSVAAAGTSAWRRHGIRRRAVLIGIAAALYAGVLIPHGAELLSFNRRHALLNSGFDAVVQSLNAEFTRDGREPVFVIWGVGFPYEWASPFSSLRRISALNLIPLGWYTHSPLYRDTLKRFSIGNLYTDLYERDDLYLMSPPGVAKSYRRYVKQHFGEDVGFDSKRFYHRRFPVIKVTRREAEEARASELP